MKLARKQDNRFRQGRISTGKYLRQQIRLQNALQRMVLRKVTTAFRRWLNTTLYLYREFGTYSNGESAGRLNEELIPALQRIYRQIFETTISGNVERLQKEEKAEEAVVFGRSVDFELLVADYFANRQLVLSGISMRLATQIDRIIQNGRAEGLTLDQIASRVQTIMGPTIYARANLIARTETHNAASYANHQYYQAVSEQLDMVMKKKWVSVSDDRTRSAHAEIQGQTRNMDEDFDVGGTKMKHPGDPRGGAANVINCRCVVVYADERDIVSD